MSKHATVKLGDYTIPLIGIPPNATIDECDLCHDHFHIQQLTFTGKQFLCDKCNQPNQSNEQTRTTKGTDPKD